jgi:hypothetical protein
MSVSGRGSDSVVTKVYLEWALLMVKAVEEWINTQPKTIYSIGIRKLVDH